MITCPWCGTNYAVFQSNCSRCGGPIKAPANVAVPTTANEVEMPPSPPREISESYRWKLFLADAWVIGAGIFALIGGIFAVVGFGLTIGIVTAFVGIPFLGMGLLFLGGGGYVLYWRYQETAKTVNILRQGEAAVGQIVSVQQNFSVAVNGQHPWIISYQFQADGRGFQNKVTTLNPPGLQIERGRQVCVLYLPASPEYNTIYPHP
jgi:hypothetical protein